MKNYIFALASTMVLLGCEKTGESNPTQIAARPPTMESSGPSWELIRGKDEMTDESRITAQVTGTDSSSRNLLIVRCVGKRLEALATFEEYLGNDSRPVKYRIDQLTPKSESWSISAKGTAVFAPENADFSRQLMAAKRVIIEAEDYRGVPHRATFEWSNGSKLIGDVLTACNRTIEGLESKVPGLRKEVALELERWGPKNITLKKQVLASVAGFKGEINTQMTPEFALAAQEFHDDYLSKCKSGKIKSNNCDTIKILSKNKDNEIYNTLGSTLYDVAPKSIKKEVGSLLIFQ